VSIEYQTSGIVLSRNDHREADRMYSVFTRNHGRRELLARGSRKIRAKVAPHLESFAELDLLVVIGRRGEILAGAERGETFTGITGCFVSCILAQRSLNLVNLATDRGQKDAELYDEIVRWMRFLNNMGEISPLRADLLFSAFALKLLALLGWGPHFSNCIVCKNRVEPGSGLMHVQKGGLVCRSCHESDQQNWLAALSINDDELKLLRFAISKNYEDCMKLRLDSIIVSKCARIAQSFFNSHIPLKNPIALLSDFG